MQSRLETVKRLVLVLTGKTLPSPFPGIASGVVTRARGVCVSVCDGCNIIQLLLDLSAASSRQPSGPKRIHFMCPHAGCSCTITRHLIPKLKTTILEVKMGTERWTNVCVVHITLYSIFQPAAAKLISAFLLTANDIRDRMQLGWGRIWAESWKIITTNSERQNYRWKVTYLSSGSPIRKLHGHTIISTFACKSFPYLWLIICSRCSAGGPGCVGMHHSSGF